MLFDLLQLLVRNPFHRINFRAFHQRTGFFRQELNALRRAVRTLVVLSRQIADRKNLILRGDLYPFEKDLIHGRLRKHRS